MIDRFVMNDSTHMGPICRNLKAGDVVEWDDEQETMSINGAALRDDGHKESKRGFPEVARLLREFAKRNPDNRLCDILKPQTSQPSSSRAATSTLTVVPILGCFRAVKDWLNGEVDWTPTTELQTQFLEHFIEHVERVDTLGASLRRKAAQNAEEINIWLKKNGFDIQISPLKEFRDFAVASILDVLVEWLTKGDAVDIANAKGTFEGVRLKQGVCAFQDTETHGHPVVKIRTKTDDVLCMSICERLPDDEFAIHWKVQHLQSIKKPYDCEGVIFPMVHYDRQVDISWLKKLRTGPGGEYWEIAEALQQTKFRMNEFGARAESAAAMGMEYRLMDISKPWVVIDEPFVLWIERPGISMPLFSGTFAEDVWKNPFSIVQIS